MRRRGEVRGARRGVTKRGARRREEEMRICVWSLRMVGVEDRGCWWVDMVLHV